MHKNPIWTDCLNKAIEKHQKLTVKYERKDEKEAHFDWHHHSNTCNTEISMWLRFTRKNILQSFYLNIFIVIIYEIY